MKYEFEFPKTLLTTPKKFKKKKKTVFIEPSKDILSKKTIEGIKSNEKNLSYRYVTRSIYRVF